ncbi:MAG: 1,4-alpha-glucan branching enzyme, partial [Caulobacteraceae bacterium]|nr:1,4-alpha-glucan branching enzyme [Caulobacteraceae bacterium]
MERSGRRGREEDIAGAAPWRASDAAILAIREGRHGDPFAVLGPHHAKGGAVVRAFAPHAGHLSVEVEGVLHPLERRSWDGFFEGLVKGANPETVYRFRASNDDGTSWSFDDPYRFAASLGSTDDYLLVEGSHRRLYERLGAHIAYHQHTGGVRFSVWAPHALVVSVVGEFNGWDGRRHPMRKRVDSGIWELFIPELTEGVTYKFEIRGPDGNLVPLKADPFGFAAELRPSTASRVARTDNLTWSDEAYLAARAPMNFRRAPVSIYEVHLGSWRRGLDGAFLSYDDFADQLVDYAVDMGFTHLELMPVNEHPLDDSWGYQPVGLFAPTSRFGDPAGFARLVDRAHQAGLGVLLDWTPAHFPVDSHGLANFDGEPLYEHPDPRRGFHPQWTTAIYDYGRREVTNFLHANALYWLDRFHIDGLRVDAVASMLYLDYAREDGEWLPNDKGGNENFEAVAFMQELNRLTYEQAPGSMMVAEESTAWPGVSAPTYAGDLGFGFKWNMGWMNDTLR